MSDNDRSGTTTATTTGAGPPAGEVGSPSEASGNGAAAGEATSGAGTAVLVNRGLELWNERRKAWLSKGKKGGEGGAGASTAAAGASSVKRARSVDVDTIIESIFSTTGDARLPQPVPLSQMIDLLVDFWEADGLYD